MAMTAASPAAWLEELLATPPHRLAPPPYLSYSQLRTYLECPAKYAFRYLYRLKEIEEPVTRVLGSLVDRAISDWLLGLIRGGEAWPGETFQALWWALDPAALAFGARYGKDPVRWFKVFGEVGTRLAEAFPEAFLQLNLVPVKIQEPVEVELADGTRFRIIPDFIGEDRAGLRLFDWKVTERPWPAWRVGLDLQLTTYALATGVERLALGTLIRDPHNPRIEVQSTGRTKDALQERELLAMSVGARVRSGLFPKTPGLQCQACPYLNLCTGDRTSAAGKLVHTPAPEAVAVEKEEDDAD